MERRDLMQMFPKMSDTERLLRDALMNVPRLNEIEQIKRDMVQQASKAAERHLQTERLLRDSMPAVESAANKMMADLKVLREPRNSLVDMAERWHRDMVQSASVAAKAAAVFSIPSACQIMTDALSAANDIEPQRQQRRKQQERTFDFARLDEISRTPNPKINRSPKPVPVSQRFVTDLDSRIKIAKSEAEKTSREFRVKCETPSGEKIDVSQVVVASDFFVKVVGINSAHQRRDFEASPNGLKLSIELIDRAIDENSETEEFVN